jgi:AAA+ superfamily predicted ATPase
MQLSKNLSLAEVIRSETAKRKGVSNMPTEAHIANFKLLAEKVFQPIREHFGVPIHISSGYRSEALNKAINNALNKAIDEDLNKVFNTALNKALDKALNEALNAALKKVFNTAVYRHTN